MAQKKKPMAETVFWDTAAFVALSNADDDLHAAAVAVSVKLAQSRTHVLSTDAILTEVANTFSKVAWRPLARSIIAAMQESATGGAATIVHIDSNLWQRGWQLFVERPDKEWSLTDCISFVVMQDYGVKRVFTSDHHFTQAGFTRLLS
jgi:predicted nucleic acid-binding protein